MPRDEGLHGRIERMLGMATSPRYRLAGGSRSFSVAIGGATIAFDESAGSNEHSLERLATAIEGAIAYDRACAMLEAAGGDATDVPLWLVSGSRTLSRWLLWSRSADQLRRTLSLSDEVGAAPVVGLMVRPTRRALGQTAARIRVRGARAVAERIELAGRMRCTGTFGRETRIRVARTSLPETLLRAHARRSDDGVRLRAADVLAHPFLADHDPDLAGIHSDGDDLVVEINDAWEPLAPVPDEAWVALPADADPTHPWRATRREIDDLYGLVDAARRHEGDDPRPGLWPTIMPDRR